MISFQTLCGRKVCSNALAPTPVQCPCITDTFRLFQGRQLGPNIFCSQFGRKTIYFNSARNPITIFWVGVHNLMVVVGAVQYLLGKDLNYFDLSLGKLLLLSEGGSNDLETEFKTFQNVFMPIIYFLCS